MSLIDLTRMTAPRVVEALDFEVILAALLADLQARDSGFDALLESDPAYKVLEVAAYRELLLRQRVNDAARACMLAYATGSDLDHLAALYGTERLLIDAGDPEALPPVDPTYEDDDALRYRVRLAPEGLTTAGSRGSYRYHSLSASALVKDVAVTSPAPCEVVVTVLAAEADGTAGQALLDTVAGALNAEDVRPLTDLVTVQAATVVSYTVEATIYVYSGPDAEVVRQAAIAAVTAYATAQHVIGHDISLSGLYAALHQPGVQRVELAQPAATLTVGPAEAAWCSAINVMAGGVDE